MWAVGDGLVPSRSLSQRPSMGRDKPVPYELLEFQILFHARGSILRAMHGVRTVVR